MSREVTAEQIIANAKTLAYWLETMPEDQSLADWKTGLPLILEPRLSAQMLRFMCPPDGRA